MSWPKGKKQDPEVVARRAASFKANPVAVAKAQEQARANAAARQGQSLSEETRQRISQSMRGKRNALGTQRSTEFKQNLSEFWTGNPNHNHYVDGEGAKRQSERAAAMSRLPYREWRTAVLRRDDHTCQMCGKRGGDLHVDHIKPWSTHPELRYDVDNGRTLCVPCHRSTPTYGRSAKQEVSA